MKLQIELSEIEEIARNKILFDLGNLTGQDLMNKFMDYTEKTIKSKFGSIIITEEYIIMNINPKCFVDFSELLNKILKGGTISIIYYNTLIKILKETMDLFKKWEE